MTVAAATGALRAACEPLGYSLHEEHDTAVAPRQGSGAAVVLRRAGSADPEAGLGASVTGSGRLECSALVPRASGITGAENAMLAVLSALRAEPAGSDARGLALGAVRDLYPSSVSGAAVCAVDFEISFPLSYDLA